MTDAERIEKLERKVKALEDWAQAVAPLIKTLVPASQPKPEPKTVYDSTKDLTDKIYDLFGRKP